MNRYVQRQMIIWTFVLVVVLGIAIALMLLQPPEKASARRLTAKSGRQPASTEAEADVRLGLDYEKVPSASDVALVCDAGTAIPEFKPNIRQVRLSGGYCAQGTQRQPVQTDIKNITNGFNATVFYLSGMQFTTDYINIKDGENQITIVHRYNDGSEETRRLSLHRAPAADKK